MGGGSNSIGLFYDFIGDPEVKMIGVEAGGRGAKLGEHAARFSGGSPGVLHGTYTFVLQTEDGLISNTHSISAGLDYPAVGPEHAVDFTNASVVIHDKKSGAVLKHMTQTEFWKAVQPGFDRPTLNAVREEFVDNLSVIQRMRREEQA